MARVTIDDRLEEDMRVEMERLSARIGDDEGQTDDESCCCDGQAFCSRTD